MAYAPRDPAYTAAFSKAMKDHRPIIADLLNGADALQDCTFKMLKRADKACGKLNMKRFEIALGCGTEAARVCAEMAGYQLGPDGYWHTEFVGEAAKINVPKDLMRKYHLSIADAV